MKMKNTCIAILFLTFISCQPTDMTEEALIANEAIREEVGLVPVGDNFTLDSTINLLPNDIKFIFIENDLNNIEISSSKYKIEYYSNKSKNLTKTLYFKSDNGEVEILREEDRFIGESNQIGKSFLFYSYNFRDKEKSFRIDSLPSDELIRKNEAALVTALKEAERVNGEICGTSQSDILEQGFPKKHTFIKEEEFNKKQVEFKTKIPAPNKP